jgi:hypothetical protein
MGPFDHRNLEIATTEANASTATRLIVSANHKSFRRAQFGPARVCPRSFAIVLLLRHSGAGPALVALIGRFVKWSA